MCPADGLGQSGRRSQPTSCCAPPVEQPPVQVQYALKPLNIIQQTFPWKTLWREIVESRQVVPIVLIKALLQLGQKKVQAMLLCPLAYWKGSATLNGT